MLGLAARLILPNMSSRLVALLPVVALGCSSSSPPPAPVTPPAPVAVPVHPDAAHYANDLSCKPGLCGCEVAPAPTGWQPTGDQVRKVLHGSLPDVTETCLTTMGLEEPAVNPHRYETELGTVIDQCLQQHTDGNLAVTWCSEGSSFCCVVKLTSVELDHRKWMSLYYPPIGDFRAALWEVKTAAVEPTKLCEWYPWHGPMCMGPDHGPEKCLPIDAAYASFSKPLKSLVCSGDLRP